MIYLISVAGMCLKTLSIIFVEKCENAWWIFVSVTYSSLNSLKPSLVETYGDKDWVEG